jgi:hypothetical protein
MRKVKTILVACMVAASLYAGASTAAAQSVELQRGTSWTDAGDPAVPDVGILGISWE